MKGFEAKKLFSSIMPVILVLSLLPPSSSATEVDQGKEDRESQQQIAVAIEEQMQLADRGSRLHEDLRNISSDREVAVIVHLSKQPVALEEGIQSSKGKTFSLEQAIGVKANVEAQQAQVRNELQEKNILYEETHAYSTVLNGFSALVKADDLKKMLEVPQIRYIEPDTRVQVKGNASQPTATVQAANSAPSVPAFLGVDKLWAEGIEGEGVKVAVLNTGIDPDHPEFRGIYKGGKNFVKHSFRYTKQRPENDPSETRPSERPSDVPEVNEDGTPYATSHGTLAAGAIAAIGANPFGYKGLAPKVDLYAYRVLGAYGVGQVSWVLAGIEEAAEQDMDVINLSSGFLGSAEPDILAYAINNATLAGTTAVIAGGSDGSFNSSIESPATSHLGIAVGTTTLPQEKYSGAITARIGEYTLKRTANLMAATFNQSPSDQLTEEYELVAVPEAGQPKDYEGIDAAGKVAVVAMGRITLEEKIRVAKAQGAVAVFLHNVKNEEKAPKPSGSFIGESFDFIPAFDLSQPDGEALRSHLKKEKGSAAFGAFKTALTKGDEVDEYSAQGPSYTPYDIKPDVVAPGMRILSTKPIYKADFPNTDYSQAYTHESGNFMAAAHVTGIAALLKQAHPDWTPFDIKVALSNTAKRLDKKKYDVFAQGAGRVQAFAAAHPKVLAYAQDKAVLNKTGFLVDNPKGTVTFGEYSLKEKNLSVSKKILVKDIEGGGGQYKATVEVTQPHRDTKVTVDKPAFNLAKEEELTVTLTASKTEEEDTEAAIFGFIHLTKGDMTISLPFAAGLGKEQNIEIEQAVLSERDLSPNGDGVKDKARLSFELTGDVINFDVSLFDLNGEFFEGQAIFTEVGYLFEEGALKKGKHNFLIDGTYRPWNGDPRATIPDGLYGIQFIGRIVDDEGFPALVNSISPFIVKTTQPLITGAISGSTATGKVTDKYVDYNKDLRGNEKDYDLNEKLKAAYIVTRNGEEGDPVPFNLNQDGSFSVPVPTDEEVETITVHVTDAAGNKGDKVLYQK
ncbi:S8 family serine peptidase [Planococcus sp. N028]|uniref:S8 family serine peptidase n=1 Tax=Planococcus shixiaomingii TaxID=3058393 RepID=A0ABT8N207_9BACL|nr:S8 family serine peptidase [Planococcus sp. N028]MDN7241729.1 S8 family serine peptidase [Planococcus sp. N028]